jgi:AraC-like DNA-binding protein
MLTAFIYQLASAYLAIEKINQEIADNLGFEDEKYFNRLFRKVIGVSPGTFRKKGETSVHL